MQIRIHQLLEGAREARGIAVIIDVFRAFSLAPLIIYQGAEKIIPVGDIDEAYALKLAFPDYILIGERNEKMPSGFDYGNSPTRIENIDFTSKTIIHTTSAGTQGIINAYHAEEIITGSFVNASAIVKYIKSRKPQLVSLVCMGYSALKPADEDTFCAEYIKSLLEGHDYPLEAKIEKLKIGSGKRLLDPNNDAHSPARDFELCTRINSFNFILKAQRVNDLIELVKIDS